MPPLKKGTLSGWTIVHISETGQDFVRLESQDARINNERFSPVGNLADAGVNDIFAVKFKQGALIQAVELQKG